MGKTSDQPPKICCKVVNNPVVQQDSKTVTMRFKATRCMMVLALVLHYAAISYAHDANVSLPLRIESLPLDAHDHESAHPLENAHTHEKAQYHDPNVPHHTEAHNPAPLVSPLALFWGWFTAYFSPSPATARTECLMWNGPGQDVCVSWTTVTPGLIVDEDEETLKERSNMCWVRCGGVGMECQANMLAEDKILYYCV